jgi:enoyl-[acyl-carrier protein] reductase III
MAILITGGSKGIGRAIAERFAEPGTDVFLNYAHDDAAAEAAAEAVRERGATPHLLKLDITGPEACARLVEQVTERTDHLDQIVHGAVRPASHRALDIPPETFLDCIQLNGAGLLYLVQAARPLLRRGSTVFFLSSRGSKVAVPNYVGIGAPKALAEAIARYLAVELAPDGIRVHIVSASALLTDAFRAVIPNADERFAAAAAANPSGRNLEVEDVANAVHWLASPEAEMITGRELFLDGGLYTKT